MGPVLTAILGGSGPIGKAIEIAVDRLIPDKHLAERLAAEIQVEFARADIQGQLAQLEVNKIEAANPNAWVSGWRPFVGWVCGGGLAFQFLIAPLLTWLSGTQVPPLDMGTLMTLLLGMLGLGGMRTAEKFKGVAS